MNKNIIFLIGAFSFILGGALVWFIKPSPVSTEHTDHVASSMSQAEDQEEIWTCSMHPQVRQNEPGICPICEMDLIPLDNSINNDDPTILQMSDEAVKLAQVQTFIVGGTNETGRIHTNTVEVEGTVEMDDRTLTAQSAHVGGRVESMEVTFEGQYISKGQKVATIYSTELLQASQELLTAQRLGNRVEGIEEASIQKLKNWKISDQQIQDILNTGIPIETIDIVAEEGGFIMERKVKLGDYVRQGQALYTIGSTSRVWLLFNVFESDIEFIRNGQRVTFSSPSLADREFSANISYINPVLNPTTRSAIVRAEMVNNSQTLKPGMLLTGKVNASRRSPSSKTSLSIPNSALLWTGERSVVYVQLPDTDIPTYQYREVVIAERSGGMTVVSEGLEPGERVVTNGAFAIDASAQLNNQQSMMNKDVAIKKESSPDIVPDFTGITPDLFRDQLDNALVNYIALKDAFVETNAESASAAATSLLETIDLVDPNLIEGESHDYWTELLTAIKGHGKQIVTTDDVEKQREQFDYVSEAIIKSLRAFGTTDQTYYVQYCPMAIDNKGARWVSTAEQIRNPYFGDKMMKCGAVQIEL